MLKNPVEITFLGTLLLKALDCYTLTYLYIQDSVLKYTVSLCKYLYSTLAFTVLDCGNANKVRGIYFDLLNSILI